MVASIACPSAPSSRATFKETAVLERTRPTSTAGDDGYQRIRADILFGRLRPKQKLPLEVLRETYGVSVSTLREILSRLASEGLVRAEGQRGFETAPISPEELKELAELRLLLESHAMEASFSRADVEWEGRVVSAHHKLAAIEQELRSGAADHQLWKRYDSEFHHALISNCGSSSLLASHMAVFDKYFRYLIIALSFRGDVVSIEHRQLLECALTRDAPRAKAVLAAHINECVEHALASGRVR